MVVVFLYDDVHDVLSLYMSFSGDNDIAGHVRNADDSVGDYNDGEAVERAQEA